MAKRRHKTHKTVEVHQHPSVQFLQIVPHEIAVLNWRNNPTLAQGIRYFYG